MEFWASRFHSTKHLTYLQVARLNSESTISLDGTEGDEDVRVSFQCPFCYVDIEVPLLCSHLQEEHCFDVNNSAFRNLRYFSDLNYQNIIQFSSHNALDHQRSTLTPLAHICPICATSLGKDTVGHFTLQHPHLLKKRRKSHKGHWNSSAVMLGKELGVSSANGGSNMAGSLTDPLLLPFLCSMNLPDSNQNKKAGSNLDKKLTSNPPDAKSIKKNNSNGGQDQEDIERIQRAECIQQVVMSTIF